VKKGLLLVGQWAKRGNPKCRLHVETAGSNSSVNCNARSPKGRPSEKTWEALAAKAQSKSDRAGKTLNALVEQKTENSFSA
jgi:hypothetical protein